MRTRKHVVCLVAALTLAVIPMRAAAAEGEWGEFGLGVASFGATLLYFPAKLTCATVGGLVGVMAYGVTAGNPRAAREVWSPTLRGDYVITKEMFSGERPVLFLGPSYPSESDPWDK